MSFIGSFALREFRRIIRHRGFLFLVFLWPLLYAFILGRIYSTRVITKLPVVLVDEDHSQLSRLIVRYLEASRSFQVVRTLENPREIEDILANNEAMVGLAIPRHLERNIKRGKPERVIAFVNASNLSIGNLANSELRAVVGTVSAGIQMRYLMKTGSSSIKAQQQIQAVKIEAARLYNPGFSYLNFLAPGLWAAILHQLLMLFGALAFVREFELGRSDELWDLAEGKAWRLLLGKLLPYLVIGTLLFSAFFGVLFPLFDISIEGFGINVLIFSLPMVLCALSYGFALSAFPRDSMGALKGVLLVTSPAFTLSGFVWPLAAMPLPLQWLAQIIPLTPYLSGYRKLIQEGAALSSVTMEGGQLLLLAILALFFAWLGLNKGRKQAA